MKKIITICLIMAATFATQAQNRYYVIVGEEKTDVFNGPPVVSNVFPMTCEEIKVERYKENKATNNFMEYYDAEYKSDRKTYGVHDLKTYGFESYDEANNERTKWIAFFKNKDLNPLQVRGFTSSCK
jgi:hypothetical protein